MNTRSLCAAAAGVLLAAMAMTPIRCPAQETLESVERTASEWVKLRIETNRIETSWREERTLVESMVATLNERAIAAEEERDLLMAKTARDREELDVLQSKIQTEADDLRAFEARLKEITTRLISLRPSLPPRLADALEMAFRSLGNSDLPSGERMQIAMTVLNRCAQFNAALTVGTDVVDPGGGAPAKSLEVVYWGLGRGYAVDRASRTAWLGTPESGVWQWRQDPGAFDSIVRLLAIAANKADPDFVSVPATVTRLLPAANTR